MALKNIKEKKATTAKNGVAKAQKETKSTAKKKSVEEDELDEEEEPMDDWDKVEEDTNWDADFEEFDMPKKIWQKTW